MANAMPDNDASDFLSHDLKPVHPMDALGRNFIRNARSNNAENEPRQTNNLQVKSTDHHRFNYPCGLLILGAALLSLALDVLPERRIAQIKALQIAWQYK